MSIFKSLSNLVGVFASPIFWSMLSFLALVSIIAYLIFRAKRRDYFYIGRTKGKKTARLMQHQLQELVQSAEGGVNEAKKKVFNTAFVNEVHELEQEIQEAQSRISELKNRQELEEEQIDQEHEVEQASLKEQIKNLEKLEQAQKEELARLQRTEPRVNSGDREENKFGNYSIVRFMRLVKSQLSIVFRKLEDDVIWWGLVIVTGLLIAGDYFITFRIFQDLLIETTRSNPVLLYVASGMIALVFLVLAEVGLDYAQKKSEDFVEKLIKYGGIVLGVLLLFIYLLIIIVSIVPADATRLTDTILRTLFVPMIIAAALLIQKIKHGPGFGILLTPVKVIVFLASLALAVVLLPFETLARYLQAQSKNKNRPGPEVDKQQRYVKEIQSQLLDARQKLAGLDSWRAKKLNDLHSQINQKVEPFTKKKNSAQSKLRDLRLGSDNAALSVLGKTQQTKN